MPYSQSDAFAFLAGLDDAPVRRIDTHISAVFLAGDQVWKIKKAVKLPFLDFTDTAAREAACRAELRVNARNAPDLYLGVTPLRQAPDGSLRLGQGLDDGGDAGGEIVDWLVHMRRFDQEHLLSAMVQAGRVDRRLIQSAAEAVARAHAAAPVLTDFDVIAGLTWTIDTNQTTMMGRTDVLPADQIAQLSRRSRDVLNDHAALLNERRRAGKVRRCHGDLHCGNICLFNARPTLFDALEFSEDIASIDVFYDLAFLLMDLDHRGARDLSGYALNHYLDLTGDYQGVILLPLFMSLRAAIRAHVCATVAVMSDDSDAADQARAYLDRALAYLQPAPPRLLAVGGLSGSGKSRMGRELARFLDSPAAAVVRTDSLRKQAAGIALSDKLPAQSYTPAESQRVYRAQADICAMLLRAGRSAVADAVFAKPEQRAAIQAVADQAGAPFDGLWLETDPAVAAQRILQRKDNVSDATPDVLRRQLDYDLGEMTWPRIDTGGSKQQALMDGKRRLGLLID